MAMETFTIEHALLDKVCRLVKLQFKGIEWKMFALNHFSSLEWKCAPMANKNPLDYEKTFLQHICFLLLASYLDGNFYLRAGTNYYP